MAINLDRIQAPLLATPTLSDGGSLAANTTYYYCVVAVGGANTILSFQHYFESPRSNIVSITTTATQKTVNLSWTAPTITQSGVLNTATYQHDNYAVLRSTNIADLQGKEKVAILINTTYTNITTTTNSLVDDGVTPGTASGTKSYFWYRPHGCPKIHITGFSSTTPCTMNDLYQADLAGTLELMPSLPASGSPHRLYTPVAPADSRQLALDIIVTNFVTAGTVTLNGRDAGGDAKSEVINITGNGTYTTTKTYASIDEGGIVCTGDYDLQIIQNRWGFVEKHKFQFSPDAGTTLGSNNWTLHCSFYNEGYFRTRKENIFIAGGFNPAYSGTTGFFEAGELLSTGAARNGSQINWMVRKWFAGQNGPWVAGMKLYASKVNYLGSSYTINETAATATWFGADGDYRMGTSSTQAYVDSIFDIPCGANGFLVVTSGTSMPLFKRGLHVGDIQPRPDDTYQDYGGLSIVEGRIVHVVDNNCEIRNLNIYSTTYDIYWWNNNADRGRYKNCTFHRNVDAEAYNEPYYLISISNTTDEIFKNDFYLKVVDINGNPISGATVTLTRSDDTVEGAATTDANGNITPIEVVYCTTVVNGSIAGAGSGFATNNRGGLTPVTPKVVATQYTHTLKIEKTGYQTYKKSGLSLAIKRDWVIGLEKAVEVVMIDDDLALNTDPKNPQSDFFVKL